VVRVSEYDPGTDLAKLSGLHGFHAPLGPDGHENGGLHIPPVGVEKSRAGGLIRMLEREYQDMKLPKYGGKIK
jgi:hypothetical protein